MAKSHLKLAGGGQLSCQLSQRSDRALRDWLDSQRAVMTLWLDRLIAEGDPDDLVSLLHRQAAWLDLMKAKTG
ncbi:MAG: hypothetical protein GYB42_09380 [Alphaproteobacteria bacterium]|nr:hypothetical protein [Alphaproteobacteria bacterium]